MSNLVTISALGARLHAWFAILALGCAFLVLDSGAVPWSSEASVLPEAVGSHVLYSVRSRTDETSHYERKARRSRPGPQQNEQHGEHNGGQTGVLMLTRQRNSAYQRDEL